MSLVYAPARRRPALALLWRLDEQLGQIVASTATPAVGQMRLTWWHNALETLALGPAPAEPLLRDIAAEPAIEPAALLRLIDGWEALLDDLPLAPEQIALHAEARGATLFNAAAATLGRPEEAGPAGQLWALVDLAYRISDPETARRALEQACALLPAVRRRWPRALKPLGVLTALARRDAHGQPGTRRQGAPARVAIALRFGLFGF